MKKFAVSLFLVGFIVLGVNAQKSTSEILGSWKLISYKYGEREIQYVPDSLQKIKLFTPNRFIWVHYQLSDKVIYNSAGGTYVFEGTVYTENLEFGLPGMTPYLGVKQVYKVKFDQNKMYQSGLLSVAGSDAKLNIEEIWERIE